MYYYEIYVEDQKGSFTYKSETKYEIGEWCIINFINHNKAGLVLFEVSEDKITFDLSKIKPIISKAPILSIPNPIMNLIDWMAKYYLSGYYHVIKTAYPGALKLTYSKKAIYLEDLEESKRLDSEIVEKFNEYMKKIFPHFSDWGIDSRNNNDFIYYETWDWVVHSTDQLGKGVLSLFLICGHLVASHDSILLIDEPELALHPQMQKRLALLLSEEAKTRQIIVCTHSPYFINWNDYLNWAKFIRLNKDNDKQCKVYQLNSEPNTYSITPGVIGDWQKPQLLDIAAKEIFFAEKILFVEGQEDVWLIKKFAKDENITLNFEIFGYGSWWATNIKRFLCMAKDLWFTKAWALYDWDKRTDWEESQTEFSWFKIIILSAADIRDKNAVYDSTWNAIEPAKEGIFNSHGKIKEATKIEFKDILSQFNLYFE